MKKGDGLKASDKILDICKRQGADIYINAIGGVELYDKYEFTKNGIDLKFLKPDITPYKQYYNEFIGSLSIIDVMMFNSPEDINVMMDHFELL